MIVAIWQSVTQSNKDSRAASFSRPSSPRPSLAGALGRRRRSLEVPATVRIHVLKERSSKNTITLYLSSGLSLGVCARSGALRWFLTFSCTQTFRSYLLQTAVVEVSLGALRREEQGARSGDGDGGGADGRGDRAAAVDRASFVIAEL